MIRMSQWAEIRHMHLAEGVPPPPRHLVGRGFPALAGMNPCSSRAPTGLSLERVYALSSVSRPSIRSEIGSRRSCRATGA